MFIVKPLPSITMKEGDFSAVSFKVEKIGILKFDFFFKIFSFILVGIQKEKIFADGPFKTV